jgi:hypothetical protein
MENESTILTLDELIKLDLDGKLPEGQLLFECYVSEENKALNVTTKIHRDVIKSEKIFRNVYPSSQSTNGFRGIKTRT